MNELEPRRSSFLPSKHDEQRKQIMDKAESGNIPDDALNCFFLTTVIDLNP
jgi:hypothetical protein